MFRGHPYAAPPPMTVRWRQTAAGTALSLSLSDIKRWVNKPVEDTYFDAELTATAKAAQRLIERHCEMFLTFNTFVGTLPMPADRIRLIRRPFLNVQGVEYVAAADGEITTLPTSLYHVLPVDQDCGMLFFADGANWPDIAHRYDAIRITVRAGYGVSNDDLTAGAPALPDDVRQALLMTIASMDASHGDDTGGSSNTTVFAMKQAQGAGTIPQSARSLLAHYKLRTITVG